MNIRPESLKTAYLPVAWVYREVIEEQIAKKGRGKIIFFCEEEGICEANGPIIKMEEISKEGVFITVENQSTIRIDRIITLFGKPGAAYDEYESYSNACMSCTGGYDKDQ